MMVAPLVAAAIPGLISAGSSLLGGLFGNKNDAQDDAENMARYVGKRAIQWRVEDANAAGVHPLYALGASVMNSPPSVVGGGSDNSWIENMGQGLARSADAMLSTEGRMRSTMEKLSVERAGLENELLRSQIAVQRTQLAPSITRSPGIAGQSIVFPDGSKWPVASPNVGQQAENAYSDIGSNIFGLGNLIMDTIRNSRPAEAQLRNWFARNYDPSWGMDWLSGQIGDYSSRYQSRMRQYWFK